jgi:hypothetical protein
MPRTVSTGTTDSHSTVIDFVRAYYWTGSVESNIKLCTAAHDIDINIGSVETFVGTGILLTMSEVEETGDYDAVGVTITFDGVDQSVVALIMQNQFIGRKIEMWRAWFDDDTGLIIGTPLKLFDGVQNDPYTIVSSQEFSDVGASTVSTRAVTKLTRVQYRSNVQSNESSHNEMIKRAGGTTGDTFFQNVPSLNSRSIDWGGQATPLSDTGVPRPSRPRYPPTL